MVGVSGGQGVGEDVVVLAAVPFASDPADAGKVAEAGQFGQEGVLGALAVEFEQVDFFDPVGDERFPQSLGVDRGDLNAEIAVTRREFVPNVGDEFSDPAVRNGRCQRSRGGMLGHGGLNQHQLARWDVRRVASQQFKTLGMRLDGHNLGVWQELVAEHAEAADVGADVNDRLEGVWPQRADLVFVVEDRVGELGTGRLDVKISGQRLP